MKHTKGEWEYHGNGIFIKDKSHCIAIVEPCIELDANAKLIAASPILLEALIELQKANRRMAQWIVKNDKSNMAFTGMQEDLQATNAINKATN